MNDTYVYMSHDSDFGIYLELNIGENMYEFELYDRCSNITATEVVLTRY